MSQPHKLQAERIVAKGCLKLRIPFSFPPQQVKEKGNPREQWKIRKLRLVLPDLKFELKMVEYS